LKQFSKKDALSSLEDDARTFLMFVLFSFLLRFQRLHRKRKVIVLLDEGKQETRIETQVFFSRNTTHFRSEMSREKGKQRGIFSCFVFREKDIKSERIRSKVW